MGTLKFTIKGNAVSFEADGFTGNACREASKQYLAALGGKVSDDQDTAEAYEVEAEAEAEKAGW